MVIMRTLLNFVILVIGYAIAFYGGFALLGGPDGAILSYESFTFGIPSLIFSLLIIFATNKLVTFKKYLFIPYIVIILAWVLAIFGLQAGFFVWLFGTIIVSVIIVLYHLISSLKKTK